MGTGVFVGKIRIQHFTIAVILITIGTVATTTGLAVGDGVGDGSTGTAVVATGTGVLVGSGAAVGGTVVGVDRSRVSGVTVGCPAAVSGVGVALAWASSAAVAELPTVGLTCVPGFVVAMTAVGVSVCDALLAPATPPGCELLMSATASAATTTIAVNPPASASTFGSASAL